MMASPAQFPVEAEIHNSGKFSLKGVNCNTLYLATRPPDLPQGNKCSSLQFLCLVPQPEGHEYTALFVDVSDIQQTLHAWATVPCL